MSVHSSAVDPAPLTARRSLRAKGWMATLALLLYVLLSVAYVSLERAALDDSVQNLQRLSRHERALALTEVTVNDAVLDVNLASIASGREPTPASEIALYMESCARHFAALDEFDTAYASLAQAIMRSYAGLQAAPLRAQWIDLREALASASKQLEKSHSRLAEHRDELTFSYHRHYDTVTLRSLLLSLVGIVGFGAIMAWFFARLGGDIRRLELHARRIVQGVRGAPLAVTRKDELGHLMHAVNRMSADLDEREKRIELDEHRRSYQDKMLAVGALAAGVAHEVNNPLAVIAGVAQELNTLRGSVPAQRVAEAAQLILAQTQRAALATRNLADVAAVQPTEFDWVDVNAMLRRVVQLLGYDKRYRQLVFESDLGPDVPALRTTGATLQQVLMQLLSLGADALPHGAATSIRLASRSGAGSVDMVFEFPVRLELTQPQVQRALLLSRAMIEPLHGRLELSQDAGPVLRIQLAWPTQPVGA